MIFYTKVENFAFGFFIVTKKIQLQLRDHKQTAVNGHPRTPTLNFVFGMTLSFFYSCLANFNRNYLTYFYPFIISSVF